MFCFFTSSCSHFWFSHPPKEVDLVSTLFWQRLLFWAEPWKKPGLLFLFCAFSYSWNCLITVDSLTILFISISSPKALFLSLLSEPSFTSGILQVEPPDPLCRPTAAVLGTPGERLLCFLDPEGFLLSWLPPPFNGAYSWAAPEKESTEGNIFRLHLCASFLLHLSPWLSLAEKRTLAWKTCSFSVFKTLARCFSASSVAIENSEAVAIPHPLIWKLLAFSFRKYWIIQLMISSPLLSFLTFCGSCHWDVCLLLDRLSNLTFSFQLPPLPLYSASSEFLNLIFTKLSLFQF